MYFSFQFQFARAKKDAMEFFWEGDPLMLYIDEGVVDTFER